MLGIFSDDKKSLNSGKNTPLDKKNQSSVQLVKQMVENVQDDKEETGGMPSGDYMVHLHFQTAKNLFIPGETSLSPFLKVSVMGHEAQTKVLEKVSPDQEVLINEHIFIPLPKSSSEDIEEATIEIKAINKGFFKGDQIGVATIAVHKVFYSKDSVMKHQSFGFNNPGTQDFNKITGFVCVSIHVKGPGGKGMELTMADPTQSQLQQPILPPSIDRDYMQLFVRLHLAENLPKMDYQLIGEGTIDAYCQVKMGRKRLKSKVFKQENNKVQWNQEFLIPIEVPSNNDFIKIEVWDEDIGTFDELCATFAIDLKEAMSHDLTDNPNGRTKLMWIHLYGAPTGYKSKEMELDPSLGSSWRGRVLVEFWVKRVACPVLKIQDFKATDAYERLNKRFEKYELAWEFGQALHVSPQFEGNMKLQLQLGAQKITSQQPKTKTRTSCRWDEQGVLEFQDSYEFLDRFPYVFLYLLDSENKPVSFHKVSLLKFQKENAEINWTNFKFDSSVGKIDSDFKAGIVSFRLYFRKANDPKGINFRNEGSPWAVKIKKRYESYILRAAIYQCANLPPADEKGTSDPYVRLYDGVNNSTITTQTCFSDNNPIFYQVLEVPFNFDIEERAAPVILDVFDKDETLLDSTDDFLGQAVIFINQSKNIISDDPNKILRPQWVHVTRNFNDRCECNQLHSQDGQMLVSLQLFNAESGSRRIPASKIMLNNQSITPEIEMPMIKLIEYNVKLLALGLRDLQPTGLFPIRKAFVEICLKSILPPAQADAIQNVFTEPKESGPNPNINTIISLRVDLPEDNLFCQQLACSVFDNLFVGSSLQRQLGSFTIPLATIIRQQEISQLNLKAAIKQKKAILTRILKGLEINSDLKTLVHYESESRPSILPKIQAQYQRKISLPPTNAMKRSAGKILARHQTFSQSGIDSLSLQQQKLEVQDLKILLGSNLREQIEQQAKQQAKEEEDKRNLLRMQDQLEFDNKSFESQMIVLKPKYKFDSRLKIQVETEKPPKSLYLEVGWEDQPNDYEKSSILRKHHRKFYNQDLEEVENEIGQKIIDTPFRMLEIFRAIHSEKTGLLTRLMGLDDQNPMIKKQVGYFKGAILCKAAIGNQNPHEQVIEDIKVIQSQILEILRAVQGLGYQIDENFSVARALEVQSMTAEDIKHLLCQFRKICDEAGLGKLHIGSSIARYITDANLDKKLNEKSKCLVRIYILDGYQIAQKDLFSLSDPYLVVKCGHNVFNERENYQLDTSEPEFYKCYEFLTEFPGAPLLQIEAWDYDDFFSDDLIGTTQIELDDRYFSSEWEALIEKPIETRKLVHKESTAPQGYLRMWCEIEKGESQKAQQPQINVQPAPNTEYELRVIVWKTKGVEAVAVDGSADIYVQGFFDDKHISSTDTHWRCYNGAASFNYRLKFKMNRRQKNTKLTLQVMDKDLIGSDELLGQVVLDLEPMLNDINLTGKFIMLNQVYFDQYFQTALRNKNDNLYTDFDFEERDMFWIPLVNPERKDYNGDILISLSIVTKAEADKNPQGVGRGEPNVDPILSEPAGRMKLSDGMFANLFHSIPPAMRKQLFKWSVISLCCFMCMMCIPFIIANLFSRMLLLG